MYITETYTPRYTAPGPHAPEMPQERPPIPDMDIPDTPNGVQRPQYDIETPFPGLERRIDEDPEPSDMPVPNGPLN